MASALFLAYLLPAYSCFASPRVICNCVSFPSRMTVKVIRSPGLNANSVFT